MEHGFQTKAFGGFDKEQVLAYIAELIGQREQEQQQFAAERASAQARIAALEQQIAQLDEATVKAQNTLQEGEQLQSALKEAVTAQEEQITRLEGALVSKEHQLQQATGECARLKNELQTADLAMAEKNRQLEEVSRKALEYDKYQARQAQVQAKLNEILAKAHARADEITQEARQRAERLIGQANNTASVTYTACAKLKNAVMDLQDASVRLNEALTNRSVDFEANLEAVRQQSIPTQTPAQVIDSFLQANMQNGNQPKHE